MRDRDTIVVILAALVLVLPISVAFIDSTSPDGDDAAGTLADTGHYLIKAQDRIKDVPSGYIGIYSSADLMKIGNDENYPLNGKYIMMNDIDLSDDIYEGETRFAIGDLEIRYRVYSNAFQVRVMGTPSGISVDGHFFADDEYIGKTYTSSSNWTEIKGYPYSEDHKLTFIGAASGKPVFFQLDVKAAADMAGAYESAAVQTGHHGFRPIGNIDDPFTGTFDGNGYEIKGLEILGYCEQVGLFGQANNATIKNLILDAKITSIDPSIPFGQGSGNAFEWGTGSVVGVAYFSSIVNCEFRGSIYYAESRYYFNIGGLVGSAFSSTLANLENNGSIEGRMSGSMATVNIGGIVGAGTVLDQSRPLMIIGCRNNSTMDIMQTGNGSNIFAGGILGSADQSSSGYLYVTDSVNTGAITIVSAVSVTVGGIAGYAYSMNAARCANLGGIDVTSTNGIAIGGLFGHLYGNVSDSRNEGRLSAKAPNGPYDIHIGGLAGMTYSAYIFKCYNQGDIECEGSGSRTMIGGILGQASGSSSVGTYVVSDCYNVGNIHMDSSAPYGVVTLGGITGCLYANSKMNNCYNVGDIFRTGTPSSIECIDGIVGSLYRPNDTTQYVTSCFTKETASKTFASTNASYVENKYDTEIPVSDLSCRSTFADAGWDFKRIWKIDNSGTPSFRTSPAIDVTFDPMNGDASVTMTLEDGEGPEPPKVMYNGYTFAGWYTDINGCGKEYKGGTFTEDTVLYAHWIVDGPDMTFTDDVKEEGGKRSLFWLFLLLTLIVLAIFITCEFKGGRE